ncbi:unnamed protein product [Symbiodinium sp. KB8]|nr:unnamed protein product [Symbiodinium sp. KB8]
MSAQTNETTGQVPNGTGVQAMPAPGSAGTEAGVQSTSVPEMDSQQQQTRDVRPDDGTCSGLQTMAQDDSSRLPETTAKSVQAKPKGAAMTLDLGRRSEVEQQGSDERPVVTQSGYLTPRAGPLEAVQPSWMTSMEVPRWMVKLGNLLRGGPSHSPAELAPSPFPATSPLYSTPPGGPAFRLRSPAKARPIPATPTPPSSSSLPAEAIQAEVQRQLQGVMTQLRQYGERNEILQGELEDARRQLREMRGVEYSRDGDVTAHRGLLGDLASAPLDPGFLPGYPAALAFQDWMEVSSSTLADVSEQSGVWWAAVVGAVTNTYERWLHATPLERLGISPEGHDALVTGRWARLNARVASMLLSAMSPELRAEMVAQRLSQNSVRMVYRLHTLYQPGGSAERSDVLRRLQSPKENMSSDSLEEVLKTVRAWPRWLARCQAVNMSPPDASVLARGLMTLTDAHINRSPDAAFRTSMVRTSLRLDGQPSLENVNSYQRHLQAELETLLSSTLTSSTATTPKIKAIDGTLQPKARDAGKPSGELCKYFAKASGCRRGEKCNYSHSMSGMEKELRAKKCLRCGAESHRQKDCQVGRTQPKGGGKDQAGSKASFPGGAAMAQSLVATAGSTTSTTASAEPIQGTPWTMESLIQALALIARLEDRKLEQLRNETITTRDKVKLSVVAMQKHWNHYLYDYVVSGNDDDGWRAVRDAPFLEDLPGECLAGMIPSGSLDNGWEIMKRNGFLTRAQRRKLLNSKRWIVHLFAGDTGHWEIMRLDQGDTSVLELDVARCAGHSLCREETWSMVLWAAKHGKVDVVMGGPPGRAQQLCKGEDRDPKSLKLVARMLWLFAVAQVGREVHGVGVNRDLDVGFMLEYPEGYPQRLGNSEKILG